MPFFMRNRVRRDTDANLHLFQRFLVPKNDLRDTLWRSTVEAVTRRLHLRKVPGHELDKTLVVQISCCRDDYVSRRKTLAVKIEYRRALKTLHCVAGTQDGSAKRMVLPEILGKDFMHQVVGIVLVHLDFFENHSPLAGDVLVVKNRIQYQIAEHVEGDWQMLIQHLHAETDAFF